MERIASKRWLDEFSRYVVMDPYPFVLDLRASRGMYLATVDGERIFDWAGFYGAKLLGYNHPRLYERDYLERLACAANNKIANPDFLTPECVEYYRALRARAPRCLDGPGLELYAVNSGAEAVENLAKYFINLYDARLASRGACAGTRRMIYFEQAFHGRTIYALNLTRLSQAPIITKDFRGLVDGNIRAPFPAVDEDASEDLNAEASERSLDFVRKALDDYGDEVVGILVEPLQGAGGQRVARPEFFRRLAALAAERGVFLGFDEVQTAGGQCGTFFLSDDFGLPCPPQGVAGGKKLGNGLLYMRESMKDQGILDSTWGGNLADMVRLVQELRVVDDEGLIAAVGAKARLLVDGLKDLQALTGKIRNVRGAGLYQGFTLVDPGDRARLIDQALERESMLLLGAGPDSIRFRPALDVSEDEIRLMLQKLARLLKGLSR